MTRSLTASAMSCEARERPTAPVGGGGARPVKWTARVLTMLLAALRVASLAPRAWLRLAGRLFVRGPELDVPWEAGSTRAPRGHRWFAATYDLVTRWGEARVLSRYRPVVAGQAVGRVLEIGAGTGANFPYYGRVDQLVAVEPDPYMLRRARRRAERLGLAVDLRQAAAEALPFADASFDTVVATLVFCTVGDPARALAEVRRVLKPGGTFRFIEHVRADAPALAWLQDRLTPVWQRLGAGCHPNRQTLEAIEGAGFEIVELQRQPFGPTPLIVGVARATQGVGV